MNTESPPTRAFRGGFSLIEMAMLLIVVGLISMAVLPRIAKKTEQEVFREGRGQTRTMRDEIVGFAMENCYLPDNSTVADMSYSHKGDRWAGTTRYRPNRGLLKSVIVAPDTINSVLPEGLYVKTPSGVSSTVAFVLASSGKNGVMETNLAGPEVEIKNYQETGANVYDDVVDYVTVDYLRGQTVGCDKAPIIGGSGGGSDDDPNGPGTTPYKNVLSSSGSGGQTLGYSSDVKGNIYANGDSKTGVSSTIQGNLTIKGDLEINSWTKITGSVYVRGDVTMDSTSWVYGDIHASGNVYLNSHCVVYGNIYTNGTVITNWTSGTTVGGNINALGSVYVAGGVGGSIISGSTVQVANEHVAGNVDAAGTITVDWNGRIDGYARSGATMTSDTESRISGTKTENSPAPPRLTPTPPTGFSNLVTPKATTFVAGGTSYSIPWGNNLSLNTGGTFGSLSLSGNNVLTLSAGDYYFTSITGGWSITLRLNLKDGPINIFVVNAVDFSSGALSVQVSSDGSTYSAMTSATQSLASKVYAEAHSNWSMGTSSQWFGTIYSSGNISFGSSNTIIGSYYAAGTLIQGSSPAVVYVQSDYAKANW